MVNVIGADTGGRSSQSVSAERNAGSVVTLPDYDLEALVRAARAALTCIELNDTLDGRPGRRRPIKDMLRSALAPFSTSGHGR